MSIKTGGGPTRMRKSLNVPGGTALRSGRPAPPDLPETSPRGSWHRAPSRVAARHGKQDYGTAQADHNPGFNGGLGTTAPRPRREHRRNTGMPRRYSALPRAVSSRLHGRAMSILLAPNGAWESNAGLDPLYSEYTRAERSAADTFRHRPRRHDLRSNASARRSGWPAPLHLRLPIPLGNSASDFEAVSTGDSSLAREIRIEGRPCRTAKWCAARLRLL